MRNLNNPWEIVQERAELADMRFHDVRHSYEPRVPALGQSLPMIGHLGGHTGRDDRAQFASVPGLGAGSRDLGRGEHRGGLSDGRLEAGRSGLIGPVPLM